MSDKQLAILPTSNPLGLPTKDEWAYIKDICLTAVKSGMLPTSIKSPEAAAIIALKARELGLSMMEGFSHIYVINGKPSLSAEVIEFLARRNHPGLVFNILETDNNRCIVEGCRPEKGSRAIKMTFSMEDAKRAGLLSNPSWNKYPAAMLRARAITSCLRALGVTMGAAYTPEELGAQVDEEGHVVETTSRRVETIEKPQEEGIPQDLELKEKRELGSQILSLRTELNISQEELKEQAFKVLNIQDIKAASIDQLKDIYELLVQESTTRALEKDEPISLDEEKAPWLQEDLIK